MNCGADPPHYVTTCRGLSLESFFSGRLRNGKKSRKEGGPHSESFAMGLSGVGSLQVWEGWLRLGLFPLLVAQLELVRISSVIVAGRDLALVDSLAAFFIDRPLLIPLVVAV